MNEILSFISGALLFAGVWLINYRDPRAFVLWIVGNGLSAGIHLKKRMWSMLVRDIGFLILAVWGMMKWRNILYFVFRILKG